MHTALTPDTRWALFAPADGPAGAKAEAMARAFGYANTLPAPLTILPGSSLIEAAKAGIPGLIIEAGGLGPSFSMDTVAEVADRLHNVVRAFGMLQGEVEQHGPMTFFSNFAWVTATRGGIFRRRVKCGDAVERGDVVGHFTDVFGDAKEEAHAPADGIVLATGAGPLMSTGDIIVHIGLNPRTV
jgi:predicted deacylase